MNRKNLVLAIMIGAMMFITPQMVQAATYVVNPAGTGDYPTIQAAVNAAVVSDVIELTDGTFTGAGNRDISYAGKAITVRSQSGNPEACVIDCQGSMSTPHVGFTFSSGEGVNSKLIGVKIINGYSNMTMAPLAIYVYGASPTIDSNVFVDDGIYVYGNASPTIDRNMFHDFNTGGGMPSIPISITNTSSNAATVTIEDNTFRDCTFGGQSSYSAINVTGTGGATNTAYVNHNVFSNLTGRAVSLGGTGSVIVHGYVSENVITDCSAGVYVNGISTSQVTAEIHSNTIADCATGVYKGTNVLSLLVDKNTLWNIDDLSGAIVSAEVTCNDISDGDFVGVNGNFSEDPLFCDPENGDYHISTESPCIDGYGCGLVGALDAGCGFMITDATDVGNDQGRWLRAIFGPSFYDRPGSETPIVRYDLFRRIDPLPMGRIQTREEIANPNGLRIAGWDFVGSVPAYCEDEYSAIVPTLADSNANGMYWTTFFVRAATAVPSVFYDTASASGYSVDNLSPAPPAGFVSVFVENAYQLGWEESDAADFAYFGLYRGESEDFVPDESNLIAQLIGTSYNDNGAPILSWYKLVAVDFNGNASEAALATPDVTGVPDDPVNLALALKVISPVHDQVTVQFSLPSNAPAELSLYDVAGRLVKHQVLGSLNPGQYTLDLGAQLTSGVYFLRLTQANDTKEAKVTVVR